MILKHHLLNEYYLTGCKCAVVDGDSGTTDVAMAESAELAMENETGGVMCVGELTVRHLS